MTNPIDRDERRFERVCQWSKCGQRFLAYSPRAKGCCRNHATYAWQERNPRPDSTSTVRSLHHYHRHRDEILIRRKIDTARRNVRRWRDKLSALEAELHQLLNQQEDA